MDAIRRADALLAYIRQVGSAAAWVEGSPDLATAAWDYAGCTTVRDLGDGVIRVWSSRGCMHPDHHVDREGTP